MDVDDEALLKRYIEIWHQLLEQCFEWSPQTVNELANELIGGEHPELILHRDPKDWLVPSLVPPKLKDCLSLMDRTRHYREISLALATPDPFLIPESKTEIAELRSRLAQILERFEA